MMICSCFKFSETCHPALRPVHKSQVIVQAWECCKGFFLIRETKPILALIVGPQPERTCCCLLYKETPLKLSVEEYVMKQKLWLLTFLISHETNKKYTEMKDRLPLSLTGMIQPVQVRVFLLNTLCPLVGLFPVLLQKRIYTGEGIYC